MAGFLDSGEDWPSHSRPIAREALREAQKAGWIFRPSKGHTFGTLKCSDVEGACRLVVYSTSGPADGSATAKSIRQIMRRCSHQKRQVAEDDTSEQQFCAAEIEWRVRRVIDAVDGLDQRSQGEADALAAVESLDEAALERSEALERTGDNQALIAFQALGKPILPWPPEVAREALLDEAERLLSSVSGSQQEPLRRMIQERRT